MLSKTSQMQKEHIMFSPLKLEEGLLEINKEASGQKEREKGI